MPGMAHKSKKEVATYSPGTPPMVRPGADDKGFAKYESVDEQYKAVQKVRALLASQNPALFAVSGERGEAGKVAGMTPQDAATRLRDILSTTSKKIAETDPKIDSNDLDWRDLVPIHSQLQGGLPASSGTDWSKTLHKELGKDVIGDYQTTQFWIALGLGTLAAAAFIFSELATGGMATFLWAAAGVAASGTQAAISIEKYEDLAAAAKTATSEDKQLVSDEQVTEAAIAAIMDTAFAFLDGYQAVKGVAGAIAKTAAREALAKLGQLSGREAAEAVEKAVAELGPQETMRRTGKGAEELVAIVGEQSDTATKLRSAAADITVPNPQADPAARGSGVAPTPAGRQMAAAAQKVFERWTSLSPLERMEELLQTVNKRMAELGAPPVDSVLKQGGTSGGQMTFARWEIAVGEGRMRQATITEAQFADLVNTVAHEGQHAEQWFKMAQLEAMTGADAAAISKKLGVPIEVAEAAVEVQKGTRPGLKLAGGAAEAEARLFYESVYGANRPARRAAFKELDAAADELREAAKEWGAVEELTMPNARREAASQRLTAARARREAALAVYKRLPEEADAFRVGDAAGAAMAERFRLLQGIQAAERLEKSLMAEIRPIEDPFFEVADKPSLHVAYDKQLEYHAKMGRWKETLDNIERLQERLDALGAP